MLLSLIASTADATAIAQESVASKGTQTQKEAIPSPAQQDKSLALLRQLYAKEYSNKARGAQAHFANSLLEMAAKSENSASHHYVILNECLDVAVKEGVIPVAFDAIQQLESHFAIDLASKRLDLVSQISRNALSSMNVTLIHVRTRDWIDEWVQQDDYESCEQLLQLLGRMAQRSRNVGVRDSANARLKECKLLDRKFDDLRSANAALKKDSNDPVANQAIGEFYCITKGDFTRGLSYLAKGSPDAPAVMYAKAELSGDRSFDKQVKLADAWWDFSDDLTVRAHAGEIYQALLPESTGLKRKWIEVRLAELGAIKNSQSNSGLQSILGKVWKVTWTNGHPTWDKAIFRPDGSTECHVSGSVYANRFTSDVDRLILTAKDGGSYFNIRIAGATLQCQKIDAATGKILHEGTGLEISGN
ncbi:hypothetical protein Poly51_53380 [Rubripirellula tenax]|uniref:Uncharacterized protein n=2 Tax=Rubripirellula tenax TaxID=2528015 RepID=A0A5C6EFH7_9BACT|nr:hypothetical protein Poly51_53380 [Rubripirellula tenax]